MFTISLCMIVKNEQQTLARCLDGIRGAADEIIIVDTGSTDGTKEVAMLYTDKIYDFIWRDDFSAARNFSFSKATADYILWLDADDVIPAASLEKLLKYKQKTQTAADMIMLPYHTSFDESGACTFLYYRERLLKRSAGFEWQGAVHEAIVPRGSIMRLNIPIEHRPNKKDKSERNIKIYEKLLREKNSLNARETYYYARELFEHSRTEEAANCLKEFLNRKDGWTEDKKCACLLLSRCCNTQGNDRERLLWLLEAFDYSRPSAELCCALGEYYADKALYDSAIFWYENALSCPPPKDGFINGNARGFIPTLMLCVCHDRLGDYEKAREWHEKSKGINPSHPSVKYNDEYFAQIFPTQ